MSVQQDQQEALHDSAVILEQARDHPDEYLWTFSIVEILQENGEDLKLNVILLSWLLVLIRASNEEKVAFDWTLSGTTRTLNQKDVIGDLQGTLRHALEKCAGKLEQLSVSGNLTRSESLLLSNVYRRQDDARAANEDNLQLAVSRNHERLNVKAAGPTNVQPWTANLLVSSLVDTIKTCLADPESSVQAALAPTQSELDTIWSWQRQVPPTHDYGLHEVISKRAAETPEAAAIASWDGDLTFAQVESYSNHLAHDLILSGVKPHDFVPLCFEKSRWTVVAVLATMKAGATFVMMDPSLPLSRLQNMAEQVNAQTIVSSRPQEGLARTVLPDGRHVMVEATKFESSIINAEPVGLQVSGSTIMYIIFTSGSTGTPKGVQISHKSYTSSAFPRAKAVGYHAGSRVLDFASYAFDVSIDSMLLTLSNGGCLCIPSDEERVNDINGVIRNMRITYAGLTPSVARILDPELIASLEVLGLGGEASSAQEVNTYGRLTRIVVGYGPCECTIGCTINSSAATGRRYTSIGLGNGALIWIVDPDNHNRLQPIGAVGELLVEGPIVGEGYLNDPEKTAAAFIDTPSWLVEGHKDIPGRRGILYKTGDLGTYDPDGSGAIVFVGRKDTQIKLRGQRIELGEIESQLRSVLPSGINIVADVVTPNQSSGRPMLVVFAAHQSRGNQQAETERAELGDEANAAIAKAHDHITKVLPRYMLPTAYISVNSIPSLISGKIDRKRLKQFGSTVNLNQGGKVAEEHPQGSTSTDTGQYDNQLRQAWSEVLDVDGSVLKPDDDFFAAGGDSVTAMKLVSACRGNGLALSVADIFDHPTLSAMAGALQPIKGVKADDVLPPVNVPSDSAIVAALESTRVDLASLQDIYPCTPTQESLFTFALKATEPYVAQRVALIPDNVSIDSMKAAWGKVNNANAILRTRLLQVNDNGFHQAVISTEIDWKEGTDLQAYLKADLATPMGLGDDLARYAIIKDAASGKIHFVWTIHHVLYDGWSEPLILQQVSQHLHDQALEQSTATMRDFVHFLSTIQQDDVQSFWRKELRGAVSAQYPQRPHRDYFPRADTTIERQVEIQTSSRSPFTLATLIRGAWALVSSQYTDSDDIVFCETLIGRDITLPGAENVIGPMIATVPIRVRIDRSQTVQAYLQGIQRAMIGRTKYQHTGMQNIRRVSLDAQHACETGSGMVIQPESTYQADELGFQYGDAVQEALHFNPYALMLACGIRQSGFRVCASFDSSLVSSAHMKRVLSQLAATCQKLLDNLSANIADISCLPEDEMEEIWRCTEAVAEKNELGKVLAAVSRASGTSYPAASRAWVCNARNPNLLSAIDSVGELYLESNASESSTEASWSKAGCGRYPGRDSVLYATGDLVKLDANGDLTFVSRKQNRLVVDGHGIDLAQLEKRFARYITSHRTSIEVHRIPSGPTGNEEAEKLVVLVEDSTMGNSQDCVTIRHSTGQEQDSAEPLAKIPKALAVMLRDLQRALQDSLPPFMVPYTYVVVRSLAQQEKESEAHGADNKSEIPGEAIVEVKQGLEALWADLASETSLSRAEEILRQSWATVLGTDPNSIDLNDNFFRLGGDSVLAMKLISLLRSQGHRLSVADIFQYMRLKDAAKRVKLGEQPQAEKKPAYRAFSSLALSDVEAFVSKSVRPRLALQNWEIEDVYPVTDAQTLDIDATVGCPRTSYQYTTLYFDHGLDRARLARSCKTLVETYDILRTVFTRSDTRYYQAVIRNIDIPLVVHQAEREPLSAAVDTLCSSDAAAGFTLGSPFTHLFLVESRHSQEACFVLGLSHAQYDGISLPLLLQDLGALYAGSTRPRPPTQFAPYIALTSSPLAQTAVNAYWATLLRGSRLAVLPGLSKRITDRSVFVTRALDVAVHDTSVTLATLVATAWALVLARRCNAHDVVFGAISSGRLADDVDGGGGALDLHAVVGPCYAFMPVRVAFPAGGKAGRALLADVQRQVAASSRFDYLSFRAVRDAVGWAAEGGVDGFDSVVHHQEATEEGNEGTMPFGEGGCRVDAVKVYGDAGYPLKVVSFYENDAAKVGIVGSESDEAELERLLGELVEAARGLVGEGGERLLLAP